MQVYISTSKTMTSGRVYAFHARWFDSYLRAAQECPGWHRIQHGTQKNIDPACQGAQIVFCMPRSPHAELIPMELQQSPDYAVHHLQDDAFTEAPFLGPPPNIAWDTWTVWGGFFLWFISIPTICSQWLRVRLFSSTVACFPFNRFISMITVLNSCCTVQNRLLCI